MERWTKAGNKATAKPKEIEAIGLMLDRARQVRDRARPSATLSVTFVSDMEGRVESP